MSKKSLVYLNTWGAYNNGHIGYGWMTAAEAREFIEDMPERDGGEWFIADLINDFNFAPRNCDFCNVSEALESIELLENLDEWERDKVIALMEYLGTDNANEAFDELDNYVFYDDLDEYHESCDESIKDQLSKLPDSISCYFDFDTYHRDADMEIFEAENGVYVL